MKITIDCYGHPNTDSERFRKKKADWIEIAEDANGNTYFRYSSKEIGPIARMSNGENGETIRRWTFGAWSDRENLNYNVGMSDVLTVEMED